MNCFESKILKIDVKNISSGYLRNNDFISDGVKRSYIKNTERVQKINKYRDLMENGTWRTIKEDIDCGYRISPVIFLNNGYVWEGKHRMLSLMQVKYNMSIDFVCISGWPVINKGQRYIIHTKEFRHFLDDSVNLLKENNMNCVILSMPINLKEMLK